MKNALSIKMVAVVLALTFAVPRPALAAGEFAPFAQLLDDLKDAIDTVVGETDMVADMFEGTKVATHLQKGKKALGEAKDLLVKEEFPKNVKKAAGKIKKWSKSMDKAAKASSVRVPAGKVSKYEREINSSLAFYLNAWAVLIIVALLALMNSALSLSQSWSSDFTKAVETKHKKTAEKMAAAFLLWGMSGGSFFPGGFFWQLGPTKKGFSQLIGALKFSVFLMIFIATFQSR